MRAGGVYSLKTSLDTTLHVEAFLHLENLAYMEWGTWCHAEQLGNSESAIRFQVFKISVECNYYFSREIFLGNECDKMA